MIKPVCSFDPDKHRYTINGRPVPSVTQVIRALLPGWQADGWYLQRGQAVHACAALIAQGIDFENDPQIDGQVKACRRFFAEIQPEVIDCERQVYNAGLLYGGTYDLYCRIGGKQALIDYKAGPDWHRTKIQLGGYRQAMDRRNRPAVAYEVVLTEDGRYRMSEALDLDSGARDFIVLLGAYNIRQRFGANGDDNV